jgi:hypothetical protein
MEVIIDEKNKFLYDAELDNDKISNNISNYISNRKPFY